MRRCDGSNVLGCIFDFVDTDKNGLVSLPEFIGFCIKEARQCHLKSEDLRAHFNAIDQDGSGGLYLSEFEEFLSDMVCMTEVEAKQHEDEIKEEHEHGRLTMQEALKFYITQQVRLHKKAGQTAKEFPCPTIIPLDSAGLLERQRLAIDHLSGSIKADAKRVLKYWFPPSLTEAMMLWFGKSPALDAEIESKFGPLVEQAARGDLDDWTSDPCECTALIILLDQFPRNIFRHKPKMYDTDAKAQSVCMKVLYHNYHKSVSPLRAIFMPCLVLTHSEHFHHQELCVDIWCHLIQPSLPVDDPLRIFGMIFLNHLKVVAKFGRFPHRNEILGRTTTADESEFLNDKSFRFDLPLHYTASGKVCFEETADFAANAAKNNENQNVGQEKVVESDSPELQQCLLSTMSGWKKTLEEKFSDSDDAVAKHCGKSAHVEAASPKAAATKTECQEIGFEDEAGAAPSSSKRSIALPAAASQGTRCTAAQRATRKELMAQLLSGNK